MVFAGCTKNDCQPDDESEGDDLSSISRGTIARHWVSRIDRTCSRVRNPRSMISRRAARPKPSKPPRAAAVSHTRQAIGLVLTTDALATVRAELIGYVCC